jgi:hypothetical protein
MGVLSYQALPGQGRNDLDLRRNGANLELYDTNAQAVVASLPLGQARVVQVFGADGGENSLTVDFAFGGAFSVSDGITFSGGAGADNRLRVDDSGDSGGLRTTLSSGAVQVQRLGQSLAEVDYNPAALSALEVRGGNGFNAFTVLDTSAAATDLYCGPAGDAVNVRGTTGQLTIHGNAGASGIAALTSVVVGSQAPGANGTLAAVAGHVVIVGAPGSTSLTVGDSGDGQATAVAVDTNHLRVTSVTGWLAPIDYDPAALSDLTFLGGAGKNTVTVSHTGAGFLTKVVAGTGGDEVDVQSTTGPLEVDGNSRFDVGALGLPLRVGRTTVFLGSNPLALPGTLAYLTGAVTIRGAAQSTNLVIDDSGDSDGKTVTFGNAPIVGLAQAVIDCGPHDVFALKVYGSSQRNVFTVTDAGPDVSRTLVCGPGSTEVDVQATTGALEIDGSSRFVVDPLGLPFRLGTAINLGSSAPGTGGTLANILSPVIVQAAPAALSGSITLTADDSGDGQSTIATLDGGQLQLGRPKGWQAQVTYAGLASLLVHGGSGGNVFTVSDTALGATTTLDCGSGGDAVNVRGTSGSLVIEGNGSTGTVLGRPIANTTTVTVGGRQTSSLGGGLDNLDGVVTVQNKAHPGWPTGLTVDDRGGSGGRTGTLGAGAIDLAGLAEINYKGAVLSSLELINGSRGSNNLAVTGTGPGFPTTIDCGTAGDEVDVQATSGALTINGTTGIIGSWPVILPTFTTVKVGSPGGTLASINGTVTAKGANHSTKLIVDGSADGSADAFGRCVTVNNNAITGLAPAAINYDQTALNALTITTAPSDRVSTVTIYDTPSGGPTTLNVGTNLGSNDGGVYVAGTTGQLDVYRNSAASSPDVRVEVGNSMPSGDGSTLVNVKGPVSFHDTAQKTWVVIEDTGDTVPRSVAFSDSDVRFFGQGLSAVVSYQPSAMLGSVVVAGSGGGNAFTVARTAPGVAADLRIGSGGDTVNVQGTSDGGPVLVRNWGGYSDTVTVGNPIGRNGLPTLANIHGHVLLSDDLSNTTLIADNRGNGDSHDGVSLPALNFWADAFNGFDATNYYTSIEVIGATKPLKEMTIREGWGTDVLNVQGTAPVTRTTIRADNGLKTGPNPDVINVRQYDASGNATVKAVVSPLVVFGRPDLTTVLLDDSGGSAADRVTITPGQVGAAAADNFFGAGGYLAYSGLNRLTVNTAVSAAGATIDLTPSDTTAFFINAGSRPQAKLLLHLAGVTGPHQTVTGSGSGTWGFLNRRPIDYSGILDMETTAAP